MLVFFLLSCLVTSGLADPPRLTDKSDDILKALGESIVITCVFEAGTSITITWLKDNQTIQFNDRVFNTPITKSQDTLNIKKLIIGDDGTYTCVGNTTDGSTKGDIKVSLIEIKPNINPIEDIYLREGQSFTIPCNADAIPSATYLWTRIGKLMDSNVAVKVGDSSVLNITNAVLNNNGTYRCDASNSVGKSSLDVNIIIITGTRWVVLPREQLSVKASDETYELVVSFATTDEKPKISWYKDSILVSNDIGAMSVSNQQVGSRYTSRLYFKKLSTGNTGIYKVNIDLKSISEFSRRINMTVLSKPVIEIDEGQEVFVEVGLSITFTCLVSAFPSPKLSWKKNDTTLLSSDNAGNNYKVEGNRITFIFKQSNVQLSDGGVYTCFGTNSEGDTTKNIKLSVIPARDLTGSDDDEKIIIIVVVISVIVILVIILAAFLYVKYRDRWCTNEYTQANGTFYADLVQEEQDVSSLADIENNPYAIKKNINISMKQGPRSGTISGKTQPDHSIKGRSLRQSLKQGLSMKRPGTTNTQPENNYARLGTVVCQGKAIDFKHIVFDECLGAGEYGLVNGGRIIDDHNATVFKEVSIKMLKDNFRPQDRRDMLTELRMMRRISKHKNVIALIGWCITDDNVYVIEEYVPFDSVLTFLRAQRCLNQDKEALDQLPIEDRVDEKTLLSFGQQIASGMKHLEQLQVIHRDLACRNVYLGHEKTCKISEYGLIRDIYAENVYRKTTGGQLPVRWMAREAVFDGQYSHKSDVWSFGILLWELVTLGKIPYPGIVRTEHLLDELETGYHMENPGHISTEVYLLMSSCWNRDPNTRPTFDTLHRKLSDFLNDTEEVHIDLSKLFDDEMDGNDDFVRSPTGDFKRPQPLNAMRDQQIKEEEEEEEDHKEEGSYDNTVVA